MKKLNQTLGLMIRDYRVKAGLTQAELSVKAGHQTPQFVSLMERGISSVPLSFIGLCINLIDLPEDKVKKMLMSAYAEEIDTQIKSGKKQLKKSS